MAEVQRATSISIATGEGLYAHYGFREVPQKRAVSIRLGASIPNFPIMEEGAPGRPIPPAGTSPKPPGPGIDLSPEFPREHRVKPA